MRRDVEKVINSYKNGEIGLFEASKIVDMHPKEFLDVLVQRNKLKAAAICSSA
ncbi:hypothetical protein K8R43_04895 [archaeon]|nr:hypothetical protein [archaeon]